MNSSPSTYSLDATKSLICYWKCYSIVLSKKFDHLATKHIEIFGNKFEKVLIGGLQNCAR